jgi:hypothetical protein
VQACNDWLRLGSGRSLRKILEKYNETQQNTAPTTSYDTLAQWSSKFKWADRATQFDAEWEARKTKEREASLSYGLALDYERVEKLKRLADFLEAQIYEQGEDGEYHNVWCPDVKQIGSGADAERVDIERFNGNLLSEYRNVLDDLAKEVGGRVKKQELTGKDGGAIEHKHQLATLSDDELDAIIGDE